VQRTAQENPNSILFLHSCQGLLKIIPKTKQVPMQHQPDRMQKATAAAIGVSRFSQILCCGQTSLGMSQEKKKMQ